MGQKCPYFFTLISISVMNTYGVKTTSNHLKNYIGDVLEQNKLDATFCAYCMEYIFTNMIHRQVEGFVKFAIDNKMDEHDIKATLIHDLSGALNQDKLMTPKVLLFGKYADDGALI